jgi:hypothetical protein
MAPKQFDCLRSVFLSPGRYQSSLLESPQDIFNILTANAKLGVGVILNRLKIRQRQVDTR